MAKFEKPHKKKELPNQNSCNSSRTYPNVYKMRDFKAHDVRKSGVYLA